VADTPLAKQYVPILSSTNSPRVTLVDISGLDIFERLSNYDHQRAYGRLARRKLEHTAKWILENPHFDSWLNDGTPQCLWLSGISMSSAEPLATLPMLIRAQSAAARALRRKLHDHQVALDADIPSGQQSSTRRSKKPKGLGDRSCITYSTTPSGTISLHASCSKVTQSNCSAI
jgi:hypothetical protein